jgi:hypothetical protein
MTEITFTMDDFYERIIKPRATTGNVAAQTMLEARQLAKEGTLTPEKVRELAMKAIP